MEFTDSIFGEINRLVIDVLEVRFGGSIFCVSWEVISPSRGPPTSYFQETSYIVINSLEMEFRSHVFSKNIWYKD